MPTMDDLERRVEGLERTQEELIQKVQEMQINSATDREQIKTIFTLLEKMDKSIESIATEVKKLSLLPSDSYRQLKTAIVSAVLTGAIGLVMGAMVISFK